jgi:hypothetical protein
MKKSIIWLILSIQFIIMGCGGDSGGGSSTFQNSGNNPNFLSEDTISIPIGEVERFSFKVVAKDASNIKYYITGRDAKKFFMDVLTGELSFKTIDDIHVGSLYSFTIIAEDGVSHREMQEMVISIIEKDLTSPTPTPQNQSLTVNAGSDISAILNQPITLRGSSEGKVTSYEWRNDNGVLATTATFEYLPTSVGVDMLTLTVISEDGTSVSDSIMVTVRETLSTSTSKWMTPSKSICENSGGAYSKNACIATWENAKTICSSAGGVLPTIVKLRAVVIDCGGELNEDKSQNSAYQSCYEEKGFTPNFYWSSSTVTSDNIYGWFVNFRNSSDGWDNKKSENYILCATD